MFDHILLVGFGGPEKPEEVWPFLQNVARGRPIPEERLREVEHHYQQMGGFSPYNSHAGRLFEKLAARLEESGVTQPCFLGMRNWRPFLTDPLSKIRERGLRRGLGVVLAPHRCEASFERYVNAVEAAKVEAGAAGVGTEYLGPWHDHPLFIRAQARRVEEVWGLEPPRDWAGAELLFTAHSIPLAMAKASGYEEEVRISSSRVAAELGGFSWSVAYQSASDRARVPAGRRVGEGSAASPAGRAGPWLEPSTEDALRALAAAGRSRVIVVPVGFLFDHVEVLYDLDVEAREAAQAAGLEFRRAPTVMDHPDFVEMLATQIKQQVLAQGASR